MDGARPAWLSRTRARYVRMRWRRTGAWLWPSFVAADRRRRRRRPPAPAGGHDRDVVAAALLGLVVNVIAVILLSRPLGMLLRRVRPELPMVVARDYAGTCVVFVVAAGLLVRRHRAPTADRGAPARHRDAIARAQAWIGDRAPDTFRRNLQFVSLLAIEPGTIYRACVPSLDGKRSYCVIVNRDLPFQNSVTFSGYEPNSVLGAGTG